MKKYQISICVFIFILFIAVSTYNPTYNNKKLIEAENLKASSSPVGLIFGTNAGPISLDPHNAWDSASFNVIEQVVETLFAYDLSDPELNITPRLAAGFGTWSGDGLNYTVSLRQGVTFHDGTSFNASAVWWNFERLTYFLNVLGTLPPETPTSIISTLYLLPDGRSIINSTIINNNYEVKFVLNEKFAPFEALLCFPGSGIMSPSPLSTPSQDYINVTTGGLVGTGPFVYDEYIEDVEVNFHGYTNYWAGAPHIDELTFSIISNSTIRTMALLTGDVDILNSLNYSMVQALSDAQDITLVDAGQEATIQYLGMNNKIINVSFREAISYAINYPYIIEELLGGEFVRLRSPIPLGIDNANWSLTVPNLNLTRARQIMQSMEFGVGFNVYDDIEWVNQEATAPFATFNYTYNIGNTFREDMLVLLQDNLGKIGITVVDNGMTWQEYVYMIVEQPPYHRDMLELYFMGWAPDYNDPSNFINPSFTNRSIAFNGAQYNGYLAAIEDGRDPFALNDNVQLLMEEAISEIDPVQREKYYDRIQELLITRDYPWAWGFVRRNYDAYSNDFIGFQSNPLDKVWFYSVQESITQVKSNWLINEVDVDGVVSPGEWDDTVAYNLALNRTWDWPNKQTVTTNEVLTVRFKNDDEWLYMLYEIPTSGWLTDPEWAGIVLHYGQLSFFDNGLVELGGGSVDKFGYDEYTWWNDDLYGGQNNVEGMGVIDGDYYRFEFRKRLDSKDGLDWSLWPGEMPGSQLGPDHLIAYLWDAELQSSYEHYFSLQLSRRQLISKWLINEVNLDGVVSAGEWNDTIPYDVPLYDAGTWPSPIYLRSDKVPTIRFKNDGEWLYGLYEFEWLVLESPPESGGIGSSVFFGNPRTTSDGASVWIGGTSDSYGFNGYTWFNDIDVSGQNDTEGTGVIDGNYYRVEFRKRLDSNDGWDWSLSPGDIIGDPFGPPHFWVSLWDFETQSTYIQYLTLQLSSKPQLISSWLINEVTLDGVLSSEEWTDAIPYNISLYQESGWPTPTYSQSDKVLTVRFKNDGEWLYMFYEVPWSGLESPPESAGLSYHNFTGNPQTNSDSGWVGLGGGTVDYYGWDGANWLNDTDASGQNDTEGAGTYDNVNDIYRFEFRKRLDSKDGYDWRMIPGETYGNLFSTTEPPFLYAQLWDEDRQSVYHQSIALQLMRSEPIIITADFNLTSDIYFKAGNGIEIGANRINIDGNGYKIIGKGTGSGILIDSYNGTVIENVTIQEFNIGISVYGGINSVNQNITANYISDNNVGILLSSIQNEVTNNIIARNELGVNVSFSLNSIYRNLLINNDQQFYNVSGNIWVDPINQVGNFWSNYWGEDLDGDYIGDTDLPHEGVDNAPLLDPSIAEKYGRLPYADWWAIGRGGSPVTIQAVDPYGQIISVDVNEIGLSAFYVENEDVNPGEASIMILIAINPEAPVFGTYTFEITAEEDTTYDLEWFVSAVGDILFERTVEDVHLEEGQSEEIGIIIQKAEDPAPGDPPVIVEPGDVTRQDIDAPTVDVFQPGISEHINGSSVDVEGIATDDLGIQNITVNGAIIEFTSTNNLNDPNEVNFTTTVENLIYIENIVEIVVTNVNSNSTTVKRIVFRDDLHIISISGPIDPIPLGVSSELIGIFVDPDDEETHTAIWDWGDGTEPTEGTVNQTTDTITGSHEYDTPGVYIISLTVEDSFGKNDTAKWSQYMVIYDASGGFVTGGGWIDSPEGAYPADTGLSGKANFGFIAKYKKGARVPTGNTEFKFRAGNLNFHSDTYQWLIIAGKRAAFKGTGTINGEGSYKFILTAIDGDLTGGDGVDKFRLKIWVEDEGTGEEIIIYDNQLGAEDDEELGETTEIGGGSIVIHKKPK